MKSANDLGGFEMLLGKLGDRKSGPVSEASSVKVKSTGNAVEHLEKESECDCSKDLFEAAERGCCACCRRTIGEARRTRDGKAYDGWGAQNKETALMVAAVLGKAGCVRMLAGKEAKMQDADGWTALMRAACMGRLDCVEILLDFEAGMQNSNGETALVLAAKKNKKECVSALLEKEKDISDNEGHNARWHATGECCEMLAKVMPCTCKDLFDAA